MVREVLPSAVLLLHSIAVTKSLSLLEAVGFAVHHLDVKGTNRCYSVAVMQASTIRSKFLESNDDLGLVAVGFSGGQVRTKLATVGKDMS